MYYKIILGHIRGGLNDGFVTDKVLYFKDREKRDLFYEALGGSNQRGYGGLDMTGQRNFVYETNCGTYNHSDHMHKEDPKSRVPQKIYDDYDLSKLHISKRDPI